MTGLGVIADDLTGACDVGSSFAAAGMPARVVCDPDDTDDAGEMLAVRNTQSRGLSARAAYERVRRAVAAAGAPLLLKKIDTALRGHLGAELDATLDALDAPAAFVIAAIPAAGRFTRGGRQWFGKRLLAETEFATDPEGAGPESAIAAVIARESTRRTALVSLDEVRGADLAAALRARLAAGARYVVIDAETDHDVALATAAVLALPLPVCLAGSIALASAVASLADPDGARSTVVHGGDSDTPDALALPALIVCGSLHSTARAQIDGLVASGAVDLRHVPGTSVAAEAIAALAGGRSAALAAPRAQGTPDAGALRATESWLAEITHAIVSTTLPGSLVLIGGETSYAVVRRLGATRLDVRGRFLPLVAVSTIASGLAAGVTLVTKGGSGGDADALRRVLRHETTSDRGIAAVS